jgi:hypothetical protein
MVTGLAQCPLALAGLPLAVSGSCCCCTVPPVLQHHTPVYHQASARHVTNIHADSASLSFKRCWLRLQSAALDALQAQCSQAAAAVPRLLRQAASRGVCNALQLATGRNAIMLEDASMSVCSATNDHDADTMAW